MIRAALAPLVVAAAACSGPSGSPIVFEEVTGDRVPAVAQDMFVPENGLNPGLGASIEDVDGDGRLDLFLTWGGLFLNRSDGQGLAFEPAPERTPTLSLYDIGAAFGDFDNDGHPDLALCGAQGVKLWRNDGTGQFTDVTAVAGVAGEPGDVIRSVAWGDIDGDGWEDLAVANYGASNLDDDAQPGRLWLNQRDGTFVEAGSPVSDINVRAWVTAFADVDGDGRVDLYFGDDADIPFAQDPRPRHDLVFVGKGLDATGAPILVESAAELGFGTPIATMGIAFGDIGGGPGWDVLVTDIEAIWLRRSDAPGARYRDVTADSGARLESPEGETWWQWGAVFSDLDGDGLEDALVAQSAALFQQLGTENNRPLLLWNRGGNFDIQRDVLGGPMQARAILLADLDGDGDDDAVVAPFFDRFRFFENKTPPRAYVRVVLRGTVSGPSAAGAVVVASDVAPGGVTHKRMRVAGGQPQSSGPGVIDFGLVGADGADLEIRWPSGAVTTVQGVAAGETREVTEPQWIQISDTRPPADGGTPVSVAVDVAAAGLGSAGSAVRWTSADESIDAVADSGGVARFELAPRAAPGTVRGAIVVDERELFAHPAIDYR